jgi:hypothetical protein
MGREERRDHAEFASTFAALLKAARLTPDRLTREFDRQGQSGLVSRATVYDWSRGQHLPADEDAFRAVVRVCLQRARQGGVRPPLTDEAGWMLLLRDARRAKPPGTGQRGGGSRGGTQSGPWRVAGEWDPEALGVHKAVGGDPLPAFVRRPHDDLLDAVLDPDAAANRLVVLRGGPSTGKSRSAYNALCAGRLASWRLEYPPIPAELTRLLEEGVRPRTVIWLRELRDYADADGGQESLARLARILAGGNRVIAVTTTWEPFWNAYTADHRGGAGSRDLYLAVRALLAGLPRLVGVAGVVPGRGGVIDVPEEFSDGELAQARELSDPALGEAIEAAAREREPRRVIQYLAAVPDLLDHYEGPRADPYARAMITVAMDVARMTGLRRCTPGFLQRAAGGYLPGEHRVNAPPDWCDAAIMTAATELRGAVRALTPQPHEQGTGVYCYRLADYLDQHGRKIFAGQVPPPVLWTAATQSDPGVQADFGRAAARYGFLQAGAQLLKNAITAVPSAGGQLLEIIQPLHPDDMRPACWVAEHIALTGPHTISLMLDALRKAGADAAVTTLIQRDPAAHADKSDLTGISFLIDSLHQAGAREQVAALLASDPVSHTDTADSGIYFLLTVLHAIGATEQSAALANRAVTDDDMTDPAHTAEVLEALWQIEAEGQVKALLSREPATRADMSEPFEVLDLITALHKVGDGQQAAVLAKRAAAAADPDDLMLVSALLSVMHDAGCAQLIPARLVKGLAARVDITDAHEVATLLKSLSIVGADTEVSVLIARDPSANVGLSSASNVAYLLTVLWATGRDAEAMALIARNPLAHADSAGFALLDLFPALHGHVDDTVVSALIKRLPGEGSFSSFLRHSKRAKDYRFGRRHDGCPAAAWSWDDLE